MTAATQTPLAHSIVTGPAAARRDLQAAQMRVLAESEQRGAHLVATFGAGHVHSDPRDAADVALYLAAGAKRIVVSRPASARVVSEPRLPVGGEKQPTRIGDRSPYYEISRDGRPMNVDLIEGTARTNVCRSLKNDYASIVAAILDNAFGSVDLDAIPELLRHMTPHDDGPPERLITLFGDVLVGRRPYVRIRRHHIVEFNRTRNTQEHA